MSRSVTLWLLFVLAPATQAADSCPSTATVPPGWQPVYTRSLVVYLPPGARQQHTPSDDTHVDTIRVAGLRLQAERGMPYLVAPGEDVPMGDWPLRFSAAVADKPAHLAATWNLDGAGRDITRLEISYQDSPERELACRIAVAARPLGRIADLRLLRIDTKGKHRCALLRDGDLQRHVCAGDLVTRHYGKVERVDADRITITELFTTDSGGWRDQQTTLTVSGK